MYNILEGSTEVFQLQHVKGNLWVFSSIDRRHSCASGNRFFSGNLIHQLNQLIHLHSRYQERWSVFIGAGNNEKCRPFHSGWTYQAAYEYCQIEWRWPKHEIQFSFVTAVNWVFDFICVPRGTIRGYNTTFVQWFYYAIILTRVCFDIAQQLDPFIKRTKTWLCCPEASVR